MPRAEGSRSTADEAAAAAAAEVDVAAALLSPPAAAPLMRRSSRSASCFFAAASAPGCRSSRSALSWAVRAVFRAAIDAANWRSASNSKMMTVC